MKTMKRNEEEEEDKCSECVFTAHSAKERKTTTIHEPKVHTWTSIAKSLFAGGIAGGVSRTAVAPLERLKILQQVQRSDGDGVRNGVQRIEHDFTKRWSERVFYRERGELHTDCSELRGEVLLLRTHNGCDISVSEDFRPGVRDERV